MINDYFTQAFVINLDDRLDKWQTVKLELEKVHIANYTRFSAIKPDIKNVPQEYYNKFILAGASHEKYKIGATGCKMSHVEILKTARDMQLENVVIFEDDVVFTEEASQLLAAAVSQIKDGNIEWDMIHLSGRHLKPFKHVSKNVARIFATYTTHGYVANSSLYDIIIDNALQSGREIDVYYATEIHPNYNCYCIRPPLLWQATGFSDILQGNRDYKVLRE